MKPAFALALLAALPVAHADPAWEPLARIRGCAEAEVRAHSGPGARVVAISLDERLRLPACDTEPRAQIASTLGGAQVNVAVQCAGPTAWSIQVPVKIADTRKVLVLTRSVVRGQVLDAAAVELQERDTAVLPFGFIGDPAEAAGKMLKRPLAAGAVLTPDALEAPKLVRRGELVTLLGRAGALEIRAQGRALADGSDGQRITVENLGSRRVVEGVVLDAGTVEVPL